PRGGGQRQDPQVQLRGDQAGDPAGHEEPAVDVRGHLAEGHREAPVRGVMRETPPQPPLRKGGREGARASLGFPPCKGGGSGGVETPALSPGPTTSATYSLTNMTPWPARNRGS